ncbi:MAG: hypothetical protein GXO75_12195 [Calditrichaeota bacterium]|nr:hypothetical protein [Calditrichota bacterium]
MSKVVIILPFVLLAAFLARCSKEFSSTDYYPMKKDYTWVYSGHTSKIRITDENDLAGGTQFTLTYYDSLGEESWQEVFVQKENGLYWRSFISRITLPANITFNPPLPITPMSEKIGAVERVESTESRNDSTTTTLRIRVENEIDAIEDVVVAAGKFSNCIRVKMTIIYTEPTERPLFAGTSYWWFARGVGPVKFLTAATGGELEGATLGNRKIPAD